MTYEKLYKTQYEITSDEYRIYIQTIKESYRESYKKINDLLKESYAKLSTVKPEDYYNELIKFNRYNSLIAKIEKDYKQATKVSFSAVKEGGILSANNMFYRSTYSAEWAGQLMFVPVDSKLIEASVTGSIDVWKDITTNRKWQGVLPQYGTLSELFNNNASIDLQKIRTTLTSSLLNGFSYTKTSEAIRDIMNNAAYKSLRIARTEGNRALNNGSYIQGKEAELQGVDIIKMWDTTFDVRTRETHANADKQERKLDDNFNVGGATGLFPSQLDSVSENVNCRCSSTNLANGMQPQTKRARNPVKEIQWQSATATERKNGMLQDGTRIYSRSEQTDIIQNRSFNEWMQLNNIKYNSKGKIVNT
jgi:hypothetical protein